MFPAKIEGIIVSSAKNEFLVGYKLLFVHPVDSSGQLIGKKNFIALKLIDAGIGDKVIVVQKGEVV